MFVGAPTPKTGSVAGEQFLVEDCENCNVFLFDHCTNVIVDRCANCRVFVGPCDTSVSLRECTDCAFTVYCQQLRTRELRNCDIRLFCSTDPVLELCTGTRIGMAMESYFEINAHMRRAGLRKWCNRWSAVHNFTPEVGGWEALPIVIEDEEETATGAVESSEGTQGQLMPAGTFHALPADARESVNATVKARDALVPVTAGVAGKASGTPVIAVFLQVSTEGALDDLVAPLNALCGGGGGDDDDEATGSMKIVVGETYCTTVESAAAVGPGGGGARGGRGGAWFLNAGTRLVSGGGGEGGGCGNHGAVRNSKQGGGVGMVLGIELILQLHGSTAAEEQQQRTTAAAAVVEFFTKWCAERTGVVAGGTAVVNAPEARAMSEAFFGLLRGQETDR